MIASLIVTLDEGTTDLSEIASQMSRVPGVEINDSNALSHRLPVIIDSLDPNSLEEITRRLQQIPGVAFVDVVFVHFEDESDSDPATPSGKSTCP
jgi:nitrate reductase NapAB chaperone NapD